MNAQTKRMDAVVPLALMPQNINQFYEKLTTLAYSLLTSKLQLWYDLTS